MLVLKESEKEYLRRHDWFDVVEEKNGRSVRIGILSFVRIFHDIRDISFETAFGINLDIALMKEVVALAEKEAAERVAKKISKLNTRLQDIYRKGG